MHLLWGWSIKYILFISICASYVFCTGFRLVNTKCMMLVDMWKKIQHSNSVTLREVFTTKAFGDHCECILCVSKIFFLCTSLVYESNSMWNSSGYGYLHEKDMSFSW